MGEREFFEGYSIPRNKEIMRIFRDLDLVEQLGSGMPRILQSYGKECFYFSENHIRMTFPIEGFVLNEELNEELDEELNGGLKSLLAVIYSKSGKQAKDYAILLANRPIKTVQRQIAELIKKGLVERRGSRKTGGYWKVDE